MRRVYIGRLSHHVRERDIERFFSKHGRIREVLMKDGFAFVEFDHTYDAEDAVRHLNGRDLNGERVHVEFAKGVPRGIGGGGLRDGLRDGGRDMRSMRDIRDVRDSRDGREGRDLRDSRDMRDGRSNGQRGFQRNGPTMRDSYRGDERTNRSGGHSDSGRTPGGISYAEKYGPPRNTDYRVIIENLSSRVSWQNLKDLMRKAGEVTFADAHKRERNMGIVDFASYRDMKNAIETLNGSELQGKRIKVFEDKSRRGQRNGGGSGNSRRNDRSRSRSRSRGRDRPRIHESKSRSRSRSRSRSPKTRSPPARNTTNNSSAVKDPRESRSRSRSRSRTRSRSVSAEQSRSVSPSDNKDSNRDASGSRSRSKSRTRSPEESNERDARSRSPSKSPQASESRSPNSAHNDDEATNNST